MHISDASLSFFHFYCHVGFVYGFASIRVDHLVHHFRLFHGDFVCVNSIDFVMALSLPLGLYAGSEK
jgi:hypothetical protein